MKDCVSDKKWYQLSKLDIVKLCIFSLIFYNFWAIRIVGEFSIIHWALLLAAIVLSLSLMGINGIIYINEPFVLWFWMFTFATSVTGLVVASNYSNLFKAVIDNFEYAIIIGMIIWITKREESADWFIKAFAMIIFLCAITAIFQQNTFNGRLILGRTGNSNDLGIKMVYGIFCEILLLLKQQKTLMKGFSIIAILTMAYVVVQTSSRKCMIIMAFLLIYFLVFVLPKMLRKQFGLSSVLVYVGIIAVILYGLSKYMPVFLETKMFHRFTYIMDGADNRTELLTDAINIFKKNPIFGVGLNNFNNVSGRGLYSHSTIGETLSCTGAFGSTIFVACLFTFIKKLFYLFKHITQVDRMTILMCAACYLAILFFSLGVILYYDYASMLCLAAICAVLITESNRIIENTAESIGSEME